MMNKQTELLSRAFLCFLLNMRVHDKVFKPIIEVIPVDI